MRAVIGIALLFAASCSSNTSRALAACQNVAKYRLVAPSTFSLQSSRVSQTGPEWFIVELEYDAQNRMGVPLRDRQVCRFMSMHGVDQWQGDQPQAPGQLISNDQVLA